MYFCSTHKILFELEKEYYIYINTYLSIFPLLTLFLQWVLHDWNEENCIKILKRCKDSISSKGNRGKIIIIDAVINEKLDDQDKTQTKLCMDIAMMIAFNGKERTEEEWKQLFIGAGFQHYKIYHTFGFRSLIEVYP